MVVSDQEVAQALDSLLRETNPNSFPFSSINDVVHQLETKLGFDLAHKIDLIRNQINRHFLLLRSQPPPTQPPPPQPQPLKNQLLFHQNPNFHNSHQTHIPPNFVARRNDNVSEIDFSSPLPQSQQASTENVPVSGSDAPKESTQTRKRRGGPGGLNKVCGVSPALQAIVGQPALARTEIVKQLWAYIRKNNLQDPSNKRKIICNDELRLVFETDCTDMFKMNKLLAKHIIPLEPTKEPGQNSKKVKVEVEPVPRSNESGSPVIISEALAHFFGTSGREMMPSEVLRGVWDYIRVNHLEEPPNSMNIICDAKLQELLGCQSVHAMG
ncbi:DEK, C-terminal, partial [Dillenia turbinata]